MLDRIRVVRTSGPVLDSSTLKVTLTSTATVYEGKARIWAINSAGVTIVGENVYNNSSTYVAIPFNAPIPRQDDVVLVLADQGDTSVVNQAFHILDVNGGGLLQSHRILTCAAYAGSRFWEDGLTNPVGTNVGFADTYNEIY